MDEDWFEVDDPDVSDEQAAFVDVVRQSARSWPECPPNTTAVLVFPADEEDEDDQQETTDGYERYDAAIDEATANGEAILKLIMDLCDEERNLVLHTLGATLAGNRLFCSERHNQSYRPEPSDYIEPLEATGLPEELGRIAAEWFEEIIRRPVIAPPRGRGAAYFTAPGTTLPTGHRWVRGAPTPA